MEKFLLFMAMLVLGAGMLYQTNSSFRNSMHFGFEGFLAYMRKDDGRFLPIKG